MDVSVASVTERDIDLILLEEFAASPEFVRWFARKAKDLALGDPPLVSARRFVTTSTGESDLEVAVFEAEGAVHYLLIENKVASGFRPRQAERYRERGDTYIREGECTAFSTVLVAPRHYIGDNPQRFGFDAAMSYEDLCDWFAAQTEMGDRRRVKLQLLLAAIEKSERGYRPVEDRSVTEFWRRYWELASRLAPELEMPEPSSKPSGAGFVWFKPPVLPRDITIVHKLPYGNVDLQFSGEGENLFELHQKLRGYLESDMSVVRANRSGAVRLKVPPVDTSSSFDSQAGRAEEGLRAAKRLLAWYVRVAETL